jgi:hypothetical protein
MKEGSWNPNTAPRPFEDDLFLNLWVVLLSGPKWKKKPITAIQMACKRLQRFDVDFASTLVEAAIEGNYQGVVFPDSEIKYEQYKKNKNGAKQIAEIGFTRESVNEEFNRRYSK